MKHFATKVVYIHKAISNAKKLREYCKKKIILIFLQLYNMKIITLMIL